MNGQHSDALRSALISGTVLKSEGITDIAGKEIEFMFIDIDWSSLGRMQGGIAINKPGFELFLVEYSSMKVVAAR